ncbi:MAG: hypothetical protein HYX67_10655 [Candidatus Melainabacteria bacterium]|nr:hypothetical protein [Candidatus Melainabacteria bacterium]
MKYYYRLLTLLILSISPLSANVPDPNSIIANEQTRTWKYKMRVKAIKKLDHFLNWSLSDRLKKFALVDSEKEYFEIDIPEIASFAKTYNFFSLTSPIIAKVSEGEQDITAVCNVLSSLSKHGDDKKYLQFATAEILAKVMAYRELKIGQVIEIPFKQNKLERFEVQRVFNLWKGMPAFGLIPLGKNAQPILLFRGTDFSLDSKRGWASLMSDIDLAGPGLTAFQNAQFCPPGVSDSVIAAWEQLPTQRQKGFTTYVNQGDIISKVGKLFGTVYAIETDKHLRPLTAHTQLMSAEPRISFSPVDIPKENKNR